MLDLEDLRLAVYGSFVTTGQPPSVGSLASSLRSSPPAVVEGLRELAAARHLVLAPSGGDGERIVMAHPFAAVPLGFSVMGPSTLWWGGCAWDSFALPHLIPDAPEVLVATTCPGCGRALAWRVDRVSPPAGDEVAHFLVPAARMWDDVVLTCSNQRLFCSTACVDAWLAATGSTYGSVLDLATLWRLAAGWYAGRLDRGYVRREPSEAKEYLRSVGLSGSFWGL